jgi:hypothetical protein
LADLKRLGKRNAYRLGSLRAQGIGEAAPPAPFLPSFTRSRRRGPLPLWLLGFVVGAALILGGAIVGLWFLPFVVGVLAGLAGRIGGCRPRVLFPAVTAMAVLGWGIPLWWPALHGEPSGATARVIAALVGLPAYAAAGFAVTLLIAVIQALVGGWLGCTLSPRVPGS